MRDFKRHTIPPHAHLRDAQTHLQSNPCLFVFDASIVLFFCAIFFVFCLFSCCFPLDFVVGRRQMVVYTTHYEKGRCSDFCDGRECLRSAAASASLLLRVNICSLLQQLLVVQQHDC